VEHNNVKVTIVDRTPDALELLIYTKSTRLKAHQDIAAIKQWSEEAKLAELAYMKDTIKSSWEFVNYTFDISGVSRAFTHQFVRTRTGRYAQESQRTVDARDNAVVQPVIVDDELMELWQDSVTQARETYAALIDAGVPAQDARGLLPTATSTSIIAQFSLRTLHEMATTRLCVRTQGEYQDVFRLMKERVVELHPWAEPFIRVGCAQNGICVFPRYTSCPIQALTFNALPRYKSTVEEIARMANKVRHEATPVANKGRTM
jgi:flavin-dependent thymidylate synthase